MLTAKPVQTPLNKPFVRIISYLLGEHQSAISEPHSTARLYRVRSCQTSAKQLRLSALPNPHTLGWGLISAKRSHTPYLVCKAQCMHEVVFSTFILLSQHHLKNTFFPFNFFRIFVKNQFTVYTSVYSELLAALLKLPLCMCGLSLG